MPRLKNEKYEAFAQFTTDGLKRSEAYTLAGYKSTTKKNGGRGGSKLAALPIVAARIRELSIEKRKDNLEAAEIDRAYVMTGLKENIELAKAKGQHSSMNKTYEMLGKEVGMFKDTMIPDNLDEMLENMDDEALRAYVRDMAGQVGLRVVDMNDDETRGWIRRNVDRVKLRLCTCSEDSHRCQDAKDEIVSAVSEADGIPRSRLN